MITQVRMMIGLFLFSFLLTACGGGSQLTYKVTGDADEAAVSYTDDNGETIAETISLPWETSFDFDGTFEFSLTVNNSDDEGTVVCEVWADERPIGGVEGNQFAECAGSVTINRRGNSTETSSNFSRRSDGGTGTANVIPTQEGESLMATAAANLEANQAENPTATPEPSATPTAVPPTATPSPTITPTPLVDFSEKNGRFVFDANPEGSYNIYTINDDGSDLRQITFHQAKDGDPGWSPDGSEIVFVSERDGVRNLYIVGADGLNLRRLTANPESDQSPHWSPAGDQIAFVTLGESSPDIFVINSDGSGQTNLTNHPANDLSPTWSPDGSQIVFVSDRDGRNQPYLMNADGSGQTRLADIEGEVLFASWSIRNDWIALTVINEPEIDIYIIKSDGSSLTRITEDPGMDAMPVWVDRRENSFIAFVSTRDGNAELYLIDAQRNVEQITDLGVTIGFPDWTETAVTAVLDSIDLPPVSVPAGEIDFTDPTAVLEAVFAAARDEDFSYLADLCDPLHQNDRDTDTLCAITADHENKDGFIQFFAGGRIVGEVEYIEAGTNNIARINILYGPNGDLTETIELIRRDGKWYLLDM